MERFEEMNRKVLQCIGANEKNSRGGSKNKKKGRKPCAYPRKGALVKTTVVDFFELPTVPRQYTFLGVPGFKKIQYNIVFRWR